MSMVFGILKILAILRVTMAHSPCVLKSGIKTKRRRLFVQLRAEVCHRKGFIPNLHGLSRLSPQWRPIQAVLLSPIPQPSDKKSQITPALVPQTRCPA